MNKISASAFACVMALVLSVPACRSRTATDPQAPPPASPVSPDTTVSSSSTTALQIESSDSLQAGLKDATKDYPDVHAAVDSGVITLTGTVKKDQLPALMKSVHSLHPRNVVNNMVLK